MIDITEDAQCSVLADLLTLLLTLVAGAVLIRACALAPQPQSRTDAAICVGALLISLVVLSIRRVFRVAELETKLAFLTEAYREETGVLKESLAWSQGESLALGKILLQKMET